MKEHAPLCYICPNHKDNVETPPSEETAMEYSELVEYYKDRLLQRYKATLELPEMQQIKEKLLEADAETLREVLRLLNTQKPA